VDAENNYKESLAIRTALGQRSEIASSELSMASLRLAMAQSEPAEDLARKAAEEFHAERIGDQEALARVFVTDSLIAQRRFPDAKVQLDQARQISPQDKSIILSLEITSARLATATGRPQEALHQLDDIVARAKLMTLLSYEFQARLAQAEAQMSSHASRQASDNLRRLERDSAHAGFKLLARKAAEAQKQIAVSTVNQGKKTDPQVSLTTRIAEWQHLRSAPLLKRDLGYRDRVAYVLLRHHHQRQSLALVPDARRKVGNAGHNERYLRVFLADAGSNIRKLCA
jgi:hypothetical protein